MKFVISLGGSVINPGKVDEEFLNEFSTLIKKRLISGDHFFIVTGGGALARQKIEQAKLSGVTDSDQLDLLGIEATEINAETLKNYFEKTDAVQIYGGEKPGQSTDTVAVKVAHKKKASTVLNLSNIDYVYTADPKKNPKAKKIETISHQKLLDLMGTDRKPGGHYPFDPIALKLAEKANIEVVVMSGKNLKNLKNYFENKNFIGTTVK